MRKRESRNNKPYFHHYSETDNLINYGLVQNWNVRQIAQFMSSYTGFTVTRNMVLGRIRRLEQGLKKKRK